MKLSDANHLLHHFRNQGLAEFVLRRPTAALEVEIGGIQPKLPPALSRSFGWLFCYIMAHAIERIGDVVFADLKLGKNGLREEAAALVANLSVPDVELLLWKRIEAKTRGRMRQEDMFCPCGEAIKYVHVGSMEVAEPKGDASPVELVDPVRILGQETCSVDVTVPAYSQVYCGVGPDDAVNPRGRIMRSVLAATSIGRGDVLDMHSDDITTLALAVDAVSGGPVGSVIHQCAGCGNDITVPLEWNAGHLF